MDRIDYWRLQVADALTRLGTDGARGLSSTEAQRRLTEHGPNELVAARRISPWTILGEQFKNVLVIILVVAVGLSAFLGHGLEAISIAVIVLLAVLLGFVQEYRAERAMEALRRMAAPSTTVVRDDEERRIAARDLVPGDIVLLRSNSMNISAAGQKRKH